MFSKLLNSGKKALIPVLAVWTGFTLTELNLDIVKNLYGNDETGVASSERNIPQDPQLKGLIDRLQDNNAYERQRAAIALGNLGNAEAVEPLMNALNDADDFVRNFSVRSLGKLGDAKAVDSLIRMIGDKNLLVRRSAVVALGNIGDSDAIDPLLKAAKDADDLVRRAAIEAMGKLGDERGVETLIEALRDGDVYIRNGAAVALTNIGKSSLPELVTALRDWTLGPGILEILNELEWQPSSDEEKIWVSIAERDRQSLLDNWGTAQKVLIDDMASAGSRQAENAVFALIGIGQDEAIGELIGILQMKGTVAMAKAFRNSGNPSLIEAAHKWCVENGVELESEDENPVVAWGDMESS